MQPDPRYHPYPRRHVTRHEMLRNTSTGFGMLALAGLMADKAYGATPKPQAELPLAPKKPHFSPKVKNVIFCYMSGGLSQGRLVRPQAAPRQRSRPANAFQD